METTSEEPEGIENEALRVIRKNLEGTHVGSPQEPGKTAHTGIDLIIRHEIGRYVGLSRI